MLLENVYQAVRMVFPTIGIYINRGTGFESDANITGVHRMYSDVVSKVVSQNYSQGWIVAELETWRRDVCAFKNLVEKILLTVFKYGLFTLKFSSWTF